MDIDSLKIGMKVRVIDWQTRQAYRSPQFKATRPPHWADRMDEWQNKIVTISEFWIEKDDHIPVFIKEDGGRWEWQPSDFEPAHALPRKDPNLMFKKRKRKFRDKINWDEVRRPKPSRLDKYVSQSDVAQDSLLNSMTIIDNESEEE